MRMAPAKHPRQRLLNVGIGCFGILIQVGFCGHDYAAEAKAALHGLLIDERFLNRVRLRARSQTLERCDLRSRDIRYGRDTRPDCLTFNNDSATAALAKSAAEFRAAEFHIVAEDIQQRRRWIGVQRVCTAVYL